MNNSLSDFRDYMADVMYQNLVSADKSTEMGVEFLKLNIKKRRLTYNQIKKIAEYYADHFTEALDSLGREPREHELAEMIGNAIEFAWARYGEDLDE